MLFTIFTTAIALALGAAVGHSMKLKCYYLAIVFGFISIVYLIGLKFFI